MTARRRVATGACSARWCRTWSKASPTASRSAAESPALATVRRRRAASSSCSSATATTSISMCPRVLKRRPRPGDDRGQRNRQASGGPVRSRNPSLAQARALQGQGHQVPASTSSARKGRRSKMAKLSLFDRRRRRVRTALKSRAGGKPRLSVHRTGRHIYAQIIDDGAGKTVPPPRPSASSRRARTSMPPPRWATTSPPPPRRPASPPSCSIAAVTCSMAASRRWPMPPAKAGWSSEHG